MDWLMDCLPDDSPISSFINRERSNYDGDDNNLFMFAFEQVNQYFQYCKVVEKRYAFLSHEFVECHTSLFKDIPSGRSEMSPERYLQFTRSMKLQQLVHLEIEAYYLFAKILMDKIAHLIERYFGPARGCSLTSHDRFVKHAKQYCSINQLAISQEMIDCGRRLKARISDYRDKQISHNQSSRKVKATSWSASGDVRVSNVQYNPRPTDPEQADSSSLAVLTRDLEAYLSHLFQLIESNRSRSRFKLKISGSQPEA